MSTPSRPPPPANRPVQLGVPRSSQWPTRASAPPCPPRTMSHPRSWHFALSMPGTGAMRSTSCRARPQSWRTRIARPSSWRRPCWTLRVMASSTATMTHSGTRDINITACIHMIYIYIYIYIYLCLHMYTYVYIRNMYIYTYIHTYDCTYTYTVVQRQSKQLWCQCIVETLAIVRI